MKATKYGIIENVIPKNKKINKFFILKFFLLSEMKKCKISGIKRMADDLIAKDTLVNTDNTLQFRSLSRISKKIAVAKKAWTISICKECNNDSVNGMEKISKDNPIETSLLKSLSLKK